ncbi:hypothetical protein A3K64_02890 [Candidatus Micrarchaeota archaeon RBG_16_36_9]|nr:MAG: hypothetical protein A3K64_02890 [Candidatus Micrarchaeota archaeon RBG_16_36_9]
MYKTIFWFLLAWTVLSLALQMSGYNILDSILIVLVIDIIALGIIVEIGKRKSFQDVGSEITTKIENIEKSVQSLLNASGDDSIINKIEERINKQKEEVGYLLDRMSKKTLELEEKINKFGFSLAEHIESFGERLDKIERYKPEEESIPIGESVYVDEEELKEEEERSTEE